MDAPSSIRLVESNVQSVLHYILDHVEKRGKATAALSKRDGKYRSCSWYELWTDAEKIALALITLGIEFGDRVCILSQTSLEWVKVDIGILAAGAVTVPIYPSNLASECQYVADHSDARVVFCEDAEQVEKLLEVKAQLPKVEKVVLLEGKVTTKDEWVIGFSEFLAQRGSAGSELKSRRDALSPESILTIIYTSGTTGLPKGVVLTHANLVYEGDAVRSVGIVHHDDVNLLFLPLAHSFAKMLEVAWFATGHVMAFAENMTTIKENLGEVRPTAMCGVPRVFEKFYGAVLEKGLAAEGIKRRLFLDALRMSQKHGEAQERGSTLGLIEGVYFRFLKKTVFAQVNQGVQAILGGRMRMMVSGGAPLSKKIAWFFRDADIVILEGYGMTESSAATCCNLPGNNRIGTVGPPVGGTDIKIADDGEVLIRGKGVMREYWKDPDATGETLINGWLHTGDIGELDAAGSVRITDRKKDLIVTAGGKNVAPQKIENLLKTHKLISQAVVHGDKRKFLTALITLDEAVVSEEAKTRGLAGEYAELCRSEAMRAAVQKLVDSTNRELPRYETVKDFQILEADFSIETGELTAKLSVKRKVVNQKYGHFFDGFYEEKF
jgi:long-chain acyl-CoA synthetase